MLTTVTKNKHGIVKKTEADNNIIETDLNVKWRNSGVKDKTEMYILKNEECQQIFKEYTNTKICQTYLIVKKTSMSLLKNFSNDLMDV